MNDYKILSERLTNFIKTGVEDCGAKGAILGLSGGVDSAVVAILAKRALGKNFRCVMLPSDSSNPRNIQDANELCEKFDIDYELIEISPILNGYKEPQTPLQKGNFCARIRMCVLYDMSAKYDYIVLGTSNKSELCLGYGTVYGDLACAINPIGELYKGEIFELAKYLQVPDSIIEKAPSADLWDGQSDEDEIGHSYEMIDNFYKKFVDEKLPYEELLTMFDKSTCDDLIYRYKRNRFKNHMPLIAQKEIK